VKFKDTGVSEMMLSDEEEKVFVETIVSAENLNIWAILMPAVYQLVPGSKIAKMWFNSIFPPALITTLDPLTLNPNCEDLDTPLTRNPDVQPASVAPKTASLIAKPAPRTAAAHPPVRHRLWRTDWLTHSCFLYAIALARSLPPAHPPYATHPSQTSKKSTSSPT